MSRVNFPMPFCEGIILFQVALLLLGGRGATSSNAWPGPSPENLKFPLRPIFSFLWPPLLCSQNSRIMKIIFAWCSVIINFFKGLERVPSNWRQAKCSNDFELTRLLHLFRPDWALAHLHPGIITGCAFSILGVGVVDYAGGWGWSQGVDNRGR